MRAYTAATQMAVAAAEEQGLVVTMTEVTTVVAQIPYSLYDRVTRLVSDCGGKVRDQLFAEDVQLTLAFLAGAEAPFVAAMTELAAGEELCRVGETGFSEF